MNEIALANFYRVLNNEDRFPKEHELAEAAIAAKDELNLLRASSLERPLTATDADARATDDKHVWSQDGETCIKCGQKDWMRGAVCHPSSPAKAAPEAEATLNTKMLAILQRLEDWGVREDKMFTETREKTLFKLISDAQTILHEAKP